MIEVIIVRAVQTCEACPAQWDAWDMDGHYWYLRFRHGHGTAERQPSPDCTAWADKPAELSFTHEELDGWIGLEEFCKLAGLNLGLRA